MKLQYAILVLALAGCKSLDKKIIRDSALEPSIVPDGHATVESYHVNRTTLVTKQLASNSTQAPVLVPVTIVTTNGTIAWNDCGAFMYDVHYGRSIDMESRIAVLGPQTNCVIPSLAQTCYFSVASMDQDGYEGDRSDVVSYTFPLVLDIRFPVLGGTFESSTDMINWSPRAAEWVDAYRISGTLTSEFYRQN